MKNKVILGILIVAISGATGEYYFVEDELLLGKFYTSYEYNQIKGGLVNIMNTYPNTKLTPQQAEAWKEMLGKCNLRLNNVTKENIVSKLNKILASC